MLAKFSVSRPVTILMMYLGLIMLGAIGWDKLPQEFFPPISFPQLTVKTTYKDAAPEEIEILITKPIEEIVGTVSGLKRISSISKEEVSLVMAEFNWGTNMDFGALHVREKIDLIKERLPRGSEEPIVLKYNPFEKPVLLLNVTGKRTPYKLLELCKKQIKAELEKVEGVAACVLRGGQEREILVEVDKDALEASGISITKLSEYLQKSNMNYPAGTIEEDFYEYLIRSMGEFEMVPEIQETVVGIDKFSAMPGQREREGYLSEQQKKDDEDNKEQSKRLIYLRDVARVKDTFKEKTSFSRFNSQDTVSIAIQKQAGAYSLRVVRNVEKALKELKRSLPKDVEIHTSYDQSVLIKNAISGVRDAGIQGAFLSFLILLPFTNMISALIVNTTILVSVFITFFLMYIMGLSVNMISLGGLALGIGMVVDNGIVVIENIGRHRGLGLDPKKASVVGTEEVVGAVFSSTLTTIAVFFPMIFVIGVVGQIFKQLAFTITASLMASFFAAITIIPMLMSKQDAKFVFKTKSENIDEIKSSTKLKPVGWLETIMEKILKVFLRFKIISLVGTLIVFIISMFIFASLEKEFFPKVDQGQFSIKLNMPTGTKIDVTDRVVSKMERVILDLPEIKYVSSTGGSQQSEEATDVIQTMRANQAEILVTLKPLARWYMFHKPKENRRTSINEVVQRLKKSFTAEMIESGEIEYVIQESEFSSAFQSSAPVVLEVSGTDLKKIESVALELEGLLKGVKGLYGVKNSIIPPSPETKVHINKDRASQYDLTVSDISLAAQTAIKGNVSTKFKEDGKEIDIRVRLKEDDRDNVNKLRRLMITSRLGIDVPLAEVAYLAVGKGPTEIKRLGQQRVVIVTANIYKRGLNQVLEEIQKLTKGVKLPPGYEIRLTGEYEQMQDSFGSLVFALILSLVAVYMIMASQFESLWQPFIIFFTFPLSIIGVAFVLWIFKVPVGVMVFLGIIILGGVVVNNGIVLIDFVNKLREAGVESHKAVVEAAKIRLQPILMTALTTILGLVPLALAIGEGTDIQQPMAITVMAGLTVSTFLSLVILPTLYVAADDMFLFFRKNKN